MTYLPAPYEAGSQDDLAATVAAALTVSVAGITSWILGSAAYPMIRDVVEQARGGSSFDPAASLLVPGAGWSLAAVLLAIGALLLLFRRGRGLLVFGALVSVATTAVARISWGFGTPTHPIAQWPLYWGGVLVLLLALLPATGRWLRRRRPAGQPVGTVRSAVRPGS